MNAAKPDIDKLKLEEAEVDYRYRALNVEYQLLRAQRQELLTHRAQLRAKIAEGMGHAVLPPKRAMTDTQLRVERCPRCSGRLGWCPSCGAEFGEATAA